RAATGRLRRDCPRRSAFGGPQAVGGLLHGGGAALAAGGDDAVDAGLLGAEGVQVGARQDGAFLGLDARGIDPLAVAPDFVVQVRSGRGAGRADIGDDLALGHAPARAHARGVARPVAVAAVEAV